MTDRIIDRDQTHERPYRQEQLALLYPDNVTAPRVADPGDRRLRSGSIGLGAAGCGMRPRSWSTSRGRQTVLDELYALTDRELADIGITAAT